MNFQINEVNFIAEDSCIVLDKTCPIIAEKTNLKLKQENKHIEQAKKLRNTINNLQSCLNVCNAINTCFKKCYNIMCLPIIYPDLSISNEVLEIICNTLTKRTANIFNIKDIYYINRTLGAKKESLKNYENRHSTNGLTVQKKREIQRKKLLGLKD